jgi:hypothetical protein
MLRQTGALTRFSSPPIAASLLSWLCSLFVKTSRSRQKNKQRRVPCGAGEAALVRASAPRGSRELPAFALQKPTAVRPCSLRRLRDVAALRFPGCIQELRRPPDEKRPLTPLNTLLAASKPPTRRGVHIRAAGSTRLKPRDGATRLRRREQHLYQPRPREQTFDTAQRTSNLKIPAKTTPKILKTAQDTPWTRPTSTKPPSRAMWRG